MTVATATLSIRDEANRAVYEQQAANPWRGVPMDKCAQDLMAYQEIIWATRPEIIVETGTWHGGSALFLADMCELAGHGEVLTIDINPSGTPLRHPRLTYLVGDSADPLVRLEAVAWAAGRRGLVVLDSDHHAAHVLAELEAYHDLVAVGGYLVVEDTNVNGHPVRLDFGAGPAEAVETWLPGHPEFRADMNAEPFITFNPGGYLCRVRSEVV